MLEVWKLASLGEEHEVQERRQGWGNYPLPPPHPKGLTEPPEGDTLSYE